MIAAIEDAILAAAQNTLGNSVRKIESLPGGWSMDSLTRALQMAPGVYVAFLGAASERAEGYFSGRFTVYLVSKGAIEQDRRRGNSRVIGAYDMLERLLPVFDGLDVSEAGTLRVSGVENLFRDALFDLGGTVYGITLVLPNMPIDYQADTSTLDDFVTFDAKYDLDPSQAGEPVAEDTVTGLDKL